MINAKIIQSFVERVESFHRQRRDIDGHLAALYREARDQGLDSKAIKSLVRARHHGSCGDDLLKEYLATARKSDVPHDETFSALDAALEPLSA